MAALSVVPVRPSVLHGNSRYEQIPNNYFLSLLTVAVLRGCHGGGNGPVWELCHPSPINLVARLQGYIIAVCIHSVASHDWCQVKLHHSLNHTLCHPKFLPPPPYRCGHPKLLQLETPLWLSVHTIVIAKSRRSCRSCRPDRPIFFLARY